MSSPFATPWEIASQYSFVMALAEMEAGVSRAATRAEDEALQGIGRAETKCLYRPMWAKLAPG